MDIRIIRIIKWMPFWTEVYKTLDNFPLQAQLSANLPHLLNYVRASNVKMHLSEIYLKFRIDMLT